MGQALDAISEAIKLMDNGEQWEIGDEDFVVCKDGVVIMSIDEDENGQEKCNVKVIVSKPKITNIELGLLEKD